MTDLTREATLARRRRRARHLTALALVLAAACRGGSDVPAARTAAAPDTILPAPAESLLTQDAASKSIRRGLALIAFTRDSLPAHVGNELRCASCHLNNGRKAFANPLVGASSRYPKYWARTGTTVTLEDRINDCFRRSLNGTALAAAGADMRDIVAYITWLSSELKPGARVWGLAVDSIPAIPPDTVRGKTQFAMYCSRCHGPDGQSGKTLGVQHPGPPLWGPGSYSIGSVMAHTRIVAAFVHHHMPFDAPGFVADSIANDVAGLILSRPRPDFPGKALDWPNGDAPPDIAYRVTGKGKPSAPPAPSRP